MEPVAINQIRIRHQDCLCCHKFVYKKYAPPPMSLVETAAVSLDAAFSTCDLVLLDGIVRAAGVHSQILDILVNANCPCLPQEVTRTAMSTKKLVLHCGVWYRPVPLCSLLL